MTQNLATLPVEMLLHIFDFLAKGGGLELWYLCSVSRSTRSAVLSCRRFRQLSAPFARAFLGLPLPVRVFPWRVSDGTISAGGKNIAVNIDPAWTMRARAPVVDSRGSDRCYVMVYNSPRLSLRVIAVDPTMHTTHMVVLFSPLHPLPGLLPHHLSGPVAVSQTGKIAVAHQDPSSPGSALCMVSVWDVFSNKRPSCVRITNAFEGRIKSILFDGNLLRVRVDDTDGGGGPMVLYCVHSSRVINVDM